MKPTLIVLLSCATFSFAQDVKTAPFTAPSIAPQTQAQDSQLFKRLASVTWDLDTHKLVWVVQKGVEVNGAFVAKSTDRYEVSPSEAFMALKEEKRGIGDDEARSLHDLLSVLSLYCVESTVWWERGAADGAEPAAEPAAPAPAKPGTKTGNGKAEPEAKPTRVDEPAQKPKVQLIPGALVAANGVAK
jgi:hypothetical protein